MSPREESVQELIQLLSRHHYHFNHSISSFFPICPEQLRRHKNLLIWQDNKDAIDNLGITNNPRIAWTKELLIEFKDRLLWSGVSVSIIGDCLWYEGILDDFEDVIDFRAISFNQSIPWSASLLKQFEDRIDLDALIGIGFMNVNMEIYEAFKDKMSLKEFVYNQNPPWRINPKFKIESVDKSLEEILSILQKLELEIVWNELNIDYTLLLLPHEIEAMIKAFFDLEEGDPQQLSLSI